MAALVALALVGSRSIAPDKDDAGGKAPAFHGRPIAGGEQSDQERGAEGNRYDESDQQYSRISAVGFAERTG
jgi:hypothetical protein